MNLYSRNQVNPASIGHSSFSFWSFGWCAKRRNFWHSFHTSSIFTVHRCTEVLLHLVALRGEDTPQTASLCTAHHVSHNLTLSSSALKIGYRPEYAVCTALSLTMPAEKATLLFMIWSSLCDLPTASRTCYPPAKSTAGCRHLSIV